MMKIGDDAQRPSDDGDGDDKESLAVSPQTNNALMSRLQEFLPQIKEANQGKSVQAYMDESVSQFDTCFSSMSWIVGN